MSSPIRDESHPAHPLRILYAEDVQELRELVRLVLTREGHTVDCAVDGISALDILTARPDAYDLVITDHHMPRMNGLHLVRNLRRLAFKGKIMVFSSEINPSTAADYQQLAVDRVLYKPVYPSFLRQAITELFPAQHAVSA